MNELDLPTELRQALRNAARDADISAARTFGFGGSTWLVGRPTGTGPAARAAVSLSGTVQALCFRTRVSRPALIAGGTPTLDEDWQVIVLSGDVLPRDILTSADDSTTQVRVQSLETWYDYRRGKLERGI